MKTSITFTALEIFELQEALKHHVEFYEEFFDVKNPTFQKEHPYTYLSYKRSCEAFLKVKSARLA